MKKSIATLGSVMNKQQLMTINGGVSRRRYCKTLKNLILGGGYQGDYQYAVDTYNQHC
ncbi:hypothetical protein [Tenacibaculum jejuense]|uniref:Uncharacterized protein n=1 Tax=Tenacibaculum jejuense TaxID=584609 RepID=A0A238UBP9_9FLAO|nr:hypothetical protein [Tenacibaculum jejuense]SNR15904.1 Hypothetical protein TJEJU_2215 [Tenacibaculum jejuense]